MRGDRKVTPPLDHERDFWYAEGPEPHRSRRREILKRHPEIRELMGINPYTLVVILAVAVLHIGIAFSVRNMPWWTVAGIAYLIGAFLSHALMVLMHECTHRLVFRSPRANMFAGMIANLATVLPSSVSVQRYHLKHHAFQGVQALDVDMPAAWEARLIGTSPIRKAIWMLLFPVFMSIRPIGVKEIPWLCRWTVVNMIVVVAFDVAIFVGFGAMALLYLAASFLFGLGLHPLGGRWIQEHFLVAPPQETYSYYGPLRLAAFNIGYHNEHHDFPNIPWNRLPRVRQWARESYDSLASHSSWTKLLIRFILDRRITPFFRMTRTDRGRGSDPTRDAPPANGGAD
jgi:sphingolipid delta-4 desaturase